MRHLVIGAVFVAGLCLVAWGRGGPEAASTPEGVVDFVDGEALMNEAPVEIGQTVPLGARVRTGPGGVVEIRFAGRNILQVGPDSLVEIKIDASTRSLAIERGGVAAVFGKLQAIGTGGAFSIVTPTAVAGVRGTVFYFKVESADSTYVCTCNGTLGLGDSSGRPFRDVQALHHEAWRFVREAGAVATVRDGMKYHDDPMMDRLARKVRYSIPWGTTSGY